MKKILICLVAILGLVFVAAPLPAHAMPDLDGGPSATDPSTGTTAPTGAQSSAKSAVCTGLGQIGGSADPCNSSNPEASGGIIGVINTALNLLSFAVGIAAIVMIMIGGFKYVTSAGDASKVNSAKDTLLYAIVGLVVVFLAQFIVRFVIVKVRNAPVPAAPVTKTSLRLVVNPLAGSNRDVI